MMVDVNIATVGVTVGIFVLFFVYWQWLQERYLKKMETRMTRNMMLALEKLEWGDDNGRTKEEHKVGDD